MLRGHGNIKTYLYRFEMKDRRKCSCKSGEKTIDHKLFKWEQGEKERDIFKAAVLRSEKLSAKNIYF